MTLAVGLVAVVGLLVGLLVVARSALSSQAAAASDAEVRAVLLAAAQATSSYATTNGAYPSSVADLAGFGFAAVPGVELRILRTGRPSSDPPVLDFCLGAGPTGGAPTLYYQPGSLVSATPCG